MVNRYLQDRAGRRPYGRSYARSGGRGRRQDYYGGRGERNRGMDSADYNDDYIDSRSNMRRDYRYDDYPSGHEMYAYGYGQIRPREDYSDGEIEKEYKEDLHEWIEKLKHKDRFKVPKEQLIKQAKNMGIHFEEYSEDEFYAIYLAMVSDYKTVSNDYNTYIKLAKDFLEDDDMAVSPSEKVCIYLYEIVLGGK